MIAAEQDRAPVVGEPLGRERYVKLPVFGLSVRSPSENAHATLWRGRLRALAADGVVPIRQSRLGDDLGPVARARAGTSLSRARTGRNVAGRARPATTYARTHPPTRMTLIAFSVAYSSAPVVAISAQQRRAIRASPVTPPRRPAAPAPARARSTAAAPPFQVPGLARSAYAATGETAPGPCARSPT